MLNKMEEIQTLIEINPKFVLETICGQYAWTIDQLSHFEKYLLWDKISLNQNMIWSERVIDCFSERLDFRLGLPGNDAIVFTPQLIEKYKDKWDWMILTDNPNIPWSIELIEKYKDEWAWESYEFAGNLGLSSNHYLPWSEELLDKYIDKWFWGELSSNPSLPWSLGLIRKYEDRWTWDGHYGLWGLSINPSPIVKEILTKYYPERIDSKYRDFHIPVVSKNTNIIIDAVLKVFSKNIDKAEQILSQLYTKNIL